LTGCAGRGSIHLHALPRSFGTSENGRWLIAPSQNPVAVSRQYRPGTLILETEFQTETGTAAIIDFMPMGDGAELVRMVVGRSGRVEFRTEIVMRFNYGATVPWVSRLEDGTINAIAGPERLVLRTPAALYGEDLKTMGEFAVEAGEARSWCPMEARRKVCRLLSIP
jgi:GH15 family glucan-1,4-alpha-glucosidase